VTSNARPEPSRGVYGIGVAAELAGLDPQSLRLYERRALLTPARTEGGTRRYSQDDIDRLARITALLDAGLNLAGVAMVLELQDDNQRLRDRRR
jgi:MerR family transcriptional regulator/heat shock protein HspR